jgi:hypothetical protein
MRRKLHLALLILAVILLGFPALSAAQEKAPPNVPQAVAPAPPAEKAPPGSPAEVPAPTPDPKQVLQQMCDFLKNQPQFCFKAEVYVDQVYNGGRKLQYGLEVEAFFRRPDRLRINGDGDLENKQLIYDGKTLTLYDKDKNHYGAIEIAGDIDAALDKAHKEYDLRVGLAELGANRLAEHANQGLTNALYVGESKVRGVPCHHLAFDKENVHYQLWVEAGNKPLLRKVVVTQKKLPYAPQWTAFLSDWNFSPQLADNLFTFTPPEGAQKIKFMPVKQVVPPAPKGAKPKEKGGAS